MALSGLLIFCLAYILAAASPGPGIAALMARVLARGLSGTPAFIAGFVVGDLFWFGLAATGLAFLAQTFGALFLVIKYAGATYLLYLAYKLWTASTQLDDIEPADANEKPFSLFLAGLALTLGNPKVMIFFIALLPTVIDMNTLNTVGIIEIALIICIALPLILGAYALLAARARLLFSSSRALKVINRSTGTVMAGAAAAVISR